MNIEKAYEVLGLKPDASIDDLKLAYRDLVNVWHPDRFLHNPRLKEKAEQQLQEINQAYESLLSFMVLAGKEGLNEKIGAAGKHSPSQPKTEPAQKPSTSLFSIPDWFLRFLARCIDLIVFALMLGYVGAYQLFPHTVVGRLTYVFATTLVWAFVEANLLSSLGTTPGKWLLGIRVITYQGNRLSLLEAFRRSIGLWWHGLGAGVVPVMLVTMIICCFRMMKHRPMTWDISGRFFVIRDARGYFIMFVALAIVFLGCRLLFF